MELIDSHAHLSFLEFSSDVDEVINRANAKGISKIINICTDEKTLQDGLKLAQKYQNIIFTAAGSDPHSVEKNGEAFFKIVENHLSDLVAIGEVGLDYFYKHSQVEIQKKFLEKYFILASKTSLPLIIHCRDAFSDFFEIADNFYQDKKLVLHCFSGNIDEAKQALERGWYISFSGIVTFKKSDLLREVVKYVPLDRMLIETDSPLLAPEQHRGKRNEPAYLVETCQMIAKIKETEPEMIAKITYDNAFSFFNLQKFLT
ncbi:MAG: TatD family hydrolase [Chlamydiae bacterium]|nr:TatD family hydrolase [Chlamydiota bacterium]